MNFILEVSLERIALVKITTILWNLDDIRFLMNEFCFPSFQSSRIEKWQNIEDKVKEKVLYLEQPELLKEKIIGLVKPIGLQIFKWVKYHRDFYFDITCLPSEFFWTPQGTIDKKKTAELLIMNDSLDIIRCYKLACHYCLKDHVLELWNKIPEYYRKSIDNDDLPDLCNDENLILLVTYDAKKEMDKMKRFIPRLIHHPSDSIYKSAFLYSANCGNKTVAEYFFQKLSLEERDESISLAMHFALQELYNCLFKRTEFPEEYYVEVVCFLLSKIDEKEQLQLIKDHAYNVLKSFLNWPFQCFFIETAHHLWNFLDNLDYDCMLDVILDKIIHGYKDWDYHNLFGEFWRQSPISHKKYSISRCTSNSTLLIDLFRIRDKENINLILSCATIKEREEIIFNYNGKNICENLIYRQDFDVLCFFLEKCILSKDLMNKFKIEFKEHIYRHNPEKKVHEDMWNEIFQLLEDFIFSLR